MRIARKNDGRIFRNSAGKILKFVPDEYIEPNPNNLQFLIEVDEGQTFTIPMMSYFYYMNIAGNNTHSGTLVYDFILSWGDGSPTVNITSYNSPDATHTYTEKGKYLIDISSPTKQFPCWDMSPGTYTAMRPLITRVVSYGDVGIKKLNMYGCTSLVALPEQRSKLTTLLTAQYFCYGCTGLTTIPYGIFFKTDTEEIQICDFAHAFYNCSKLLSIHSTLFQDAIYARSFGYTFQGCTKITSIPAALFANCPLVKNFNATFSNCLLLNSIPQALFLYNTFSPCGFSSTFYHTNITEVPAGFFDTVRSSSFISCFAYCYELTTIPAYLFINQDLCSAFTQTFFQCRKLTHVPTGVFDISVGGVNACTSMNYAFGNCGTDASITEFTIPDNLFDDCYKVTTFNRTFQSCSKFRSIPTDLFVNCVAVNNFEWTFSSTGIQSIPIHLFDNCTEVTTFQATFYNCTSLISDGVPAQLFRYCLKVTTFGTHSSYGTFYNCNNIAFTYIPVGLFDYNTNLTFAISTFRNCTYLESIPIDLFRYNTVLTDVSYCFMSSGITQLTYNVFQYNISITSVSYCFNSCRSLQSIDADLFNTNNSNTNAIVNFSYCFNACDNVALTAISGNLFQYSVNAKFFQYAFNGCKYIENIPTGLFSNNLLIENLNYCFGSWIMTSIPPDLFAGLTQVNNVSYCFFYCHELLSIPTGLFDSIGLNRSVTFAYCFRIASTTALYNKMTSAVPELWTKPNSPTGTQCFFNRTAVSNYASIPAGWK